MSKQELVECIVKKINHKNTDLAERERLLKLVDEIIDCDYLITQAGTIE